MRKWPLGLGVLPLVVAVLGGMLAGLGVFTFGYGEGHAYLSDDSRACINGHIMQPQHDSWIKRSHAAHAICNDCHLPRAFLRHWTAKADNGFFHSWAFTFSIFTSGRHRDRYGPGGWMADQHC